MLPAPSNSEASNLVSFGKLFNYSSPSDENYLIIQLFLAVAFKPLSFYTSRGMMKSREMRGVGFNHFPSRKQKSTTLKESPGQPCMSLIPQAWSP